MLDRSSLIIHGKGEHTKRRQQIDILLKKAMRGNKQAKLRLYREFGIRVYSSDEVDKYVLNRMSQEYASDGKNTNNGSGLLTLKKEAKGISRSNSKSLPRQDRSTNVPSRGKSREKAKHLVKKI
jgi:hypothetical protein